MFKTLLCSLLVLLFVVSMAQADPFRAKFNVFTGNEKPGVKAVADGDWAGFGNIEGRLCKPFIPATFDVSGGIGFQLTTLPKAIPVLGGRKIFADALVSTQSDDQAYLGLAISLLEASKDNGFRLGVEAVGPEPWRTWYLGKAFNFDW